MERVTWNDVDVANKRIEECKQRRATFVSKYEQTKQRLYKKLALSETETIEEINNAICEAVVYLTSKGIVRNQ